MAKHRRTRLNIGGDSPYAANWLILIQLCEEKIERSKIKTLQLEALLADFKVKAAQGEPSPIDIANSRLVVEIRECGP